MITNGVLRRATDRMRPRRDGLDLLITRPWMTIAPGLMLVICVLSINVFGDALREALDPRAALHLER